MSRGSQVWYNGKVLPAEEARISLFSHGLHYGTGAFEGIRAYKQVSGGGAVFRLREHMERLYESGKILGVKLPFSIDALCSAALETCRANQFDECYIRPLIYVADGPLGVNMGDNPPIDVAILTWVWGSYLGDHGKKSGSRMKISSFLRPHVNSAMTRGKITGQYVNGVLAKREAVTLGFDEALLLDANGFVTEGSGENVFMIKDGVIRTTPPTSILNGITRRTVMEMLKADGTNVREQMFTRDELWCADEVFVCGTAAEITPVREIDGRPIGRPGHEGTPGPITLKLQDQFQKIAHGELKPAFAKDWLTPLR